MISYFIDVFHNLSNIQAAVATAFVLCLFFSFWKNYGVPPGPWGLPLLGYWPFLKIENGPTQMRGLREKYGEVTSMRIMGRLCIFLNTLKAIREAHISKAEFFEERFHGYNLIAVSFENGIAVINGEPWRVQRKFFQQKFKEYGMLAVKENYKSSMYNMVKDTVEEIGDMQGQPFSVAEFMTVKCATSVRRILFNDQGITEEELKEINEAYAPVLIAQNHKNVILMGNIARYFVFPFMPSYRAFMNGHKKVQAILRNIIARHKKQFDENQVLDIIDSYFKEKLDRERKGDPSARYFTDLCLLSSLYQFITDGVLIVSYFIAQCFEKIAQYPEVQKKIYEEMFEVLGPEGQPTMDDKSRLPYMNAFLYEVTRVSELFPVFPKQTCTRETTLRGHRIPKGATTVINLWSAHYDPNTYKDPERFNPSRFLIVPGKPKPELPATFGIGKRACMGEPITMIETFLFVATVVKNFHLTTPSETASKQFAQGNIQICAHPRSQVTA